MRADWLGPDHPQGAPPGSGVQKSLMDKLITDPNQSGDSKYTRGHGDKGTQNYVNAMLKCKAAIKGTDGKEYDTVTANLFSTFKAPAEADVKESGSEPGDRPRFF